uniref:Uncharacterized protein n=1 Tax=Opuntia streptacantha TaxID=393608 RepID=A0A7C9EDC8_OPUST
MVLQEEHAVLVLINEHVPFLHYFHNLICSSKKPTSYKSVKNRIQQFLIKFHLGGSSNTFHLTPQLRHLNIFPSNCCISSNHRMESLRIGSMPQASHLLKSLLCILHQSLLTEEVDDIIPVMNSAICPLALLNFLQEFCHKASFTSGCTSTHQNIKFLVISSWYLGFFHLFKEI